MSDDAESVSSDDESEILVYVECEGYVDSNTFKNENLSFDIVGIDSEHPIMQINGKFYEGTYRDAVGTYMFFDKDDSPAIDDPVFDSPPTLKYHSKTRKLLKMERVFAMQRTEILGDLDHTYCIPNIETIRAAGVPAKYQEEALRFWIKMRDERMRALSSYLEKQQLKEDKRSRGIQVDSESDDDDNPFAMYKPKENENVPRNSESETTGSSVKADDDDVAETEDSEISNILNRILELDPKTDAAKKTPRKPVKKLTVIDPGPSTSKRNDPDMPSLSSKKKRKSSARAKTKEVFKKPNKRAPKSKKSLNIPPYEKYLDNDAEIEPFQPEIESNPKEMDTKKTEIMENRENESEKNSTASNDEANSRSKSASLMTKKLEKQAKRDAKMKEISDRLKTRKDELRITEYSDRGKNEDSRTNDR